MYNKGDKSEFQHGDELTYTCSRGYKSPMEDPMTFPSITCEAGVWQGDTPTCDGKVIIQSTVYTDISVYGAGLCMNNIYIYILRDPSDYVILKLQSSTSYTVQVTNLKRSK